MWLFYFLVGLFIVKTIYDLLPPDILYPPRVPDPPPKPVTVTPKPQAIVPEERKFHMTLDKMLESYAPDVSNPKDVIVLSMEGSGVHLMPIFLTAEAAAIFEAKEQEDDFDSAFFGADDLMDQLGIEDDDGIIDAGDFIFYEDLHELDVSTDKGGWTFREPVSMPFKFDQIKVGEMVAEQNKSHMDNYEYCLFHYVSCSKGLSNFEYQYTTSELPAPNIQDDVSYDAQNIYYNGYKIPIEGWNWEYMDWWNPIGYTLMPVEKVKEITMGDLW